MDQTGRSSARYLTQLARSASLARSDSTSTASGGAKGPLGLPYDRVKSVFGTNASFAGRNKVRTHTWDGSRPAARPPVLMFAS